MPKSSKNVPSNYSDNKSAETSSPLEGEISGVIHQALRNISSLPKQGQPLPQQNSDCIHPALRYLSFPPKTEKPSSPTSSTGACRALSPMFRLSTNATLQSLQHPSLSSKMPPSTSACQAASKTHRSSTVTILQDQRPPSIIDNHSPLKNQGFFCQDKVSGEGSNVDSDHDVPDSFTIINSNLKK